MHDAITPLLESLALPHRYGHTCDDGAWYAPHLPGRTPCPPLVTARAALEETATAMRAVHAAAHTPALVDAVTEGMTGFDLSTLDPEDADGWRQTARMALEALAAALDAPPGQHRAPQPPTLTGASQGP